MSRHRTQPVSRDSVLPATHFLFLLLTYSFCMPDLSLLCVLRSHASEGSLMPPLVMLRLFSAVREKAPWYVRPVAVGITQAMESGYVMPTLKPWFEMIEKHLAERRAAGSDFFVGTHMTAADFMMMFPLEAAKSGRGGIVLGSETKQWVDKMHAREAYKRGLQKGGEYAFAKM